MIPKNTGLSDRSGTIVSEEMQATVFLKKLHDGFHDNWRYREKCPLAILVHTFPLLYELASVYFDQRPIRATRSSGLLIVHDLYNNSDL